MNRTIRLDCAGRTTGEVMDDLTGGIDRPDPALRLILLVENMSLLRDSVTRLLRRMLTLFHEREIRVSIVDASGCASVLLEALGGSVHVEACRSCEEITEPRRLLVVDDTPDSLEFLVELLQTAGHTVISARSGSEAVALAAGGSFDLILLDLVLPDANGLEVAAALRFSGAPVIAMSAYLERWTEEDYARAGFRSRLRKPFRSADLLAALRPDAL